MDDCKDSVLKRLLNLKRETRDHDLKLKLNLFIRARELQNVHEACRRMGMGRTFYYKWWRRFKNSGFKLASLTERSRRPKTSPKRTKRHVEDKILELKATKHGSLMIHGLLKRQNIHLSVQTIGHILNGRKKVPKEVRKKLNPHNKRYELPVPGQRIQLDVKYVPYKVEGRRTYTYVAIDECTRWRFAYAFDSIGPSTTVTFLNMMKEAFPFPLICVQTDNGLEFTNKLNPNATWVHDMDLWCGDHSVQHRLIPPGVKELNGKVERSHRIDEQYFYWKATDKNLDIFNDQLREWIEFYNFKRPHHGIGFMTPSEKLEERLDTLRQHTLPGELEWIRNKFLIEATVKVLSKLGEIKLKLAA